MHRVSCPTGESRIGVRWPEGMEQGPLEDQSEYQTATSAIHVTMMISGKRNEPQQKPKEAQPFVTHGKHAGFFVPRKNGFVPFVVQSPKNTHVEPGEGRPWTSSLWKDSLPSHTRSFQVLPIEKQEPPKKGDALKMHSEVC